ncbi:MAG: hypothetical protein RBR84_03620 [Bacteroidales bacterium]|nr:hypothetical protein [Bacteroidales bacterium]MDD4087333.1 hypothetical protein [Bacteroidales bacterium]MDY0084988.1 hypothetical protein [Bacteroidales bacterium]
MKANVFINNIQNKWHNVYWFSRMLISNDKYVAIGKEPKLLSLLASSLKVISNEKLTTDILKLQKQTLKNIIQERYKKTSTRKIRVERLLTDLDEMIKTAEDVEVFIMTCENILLPLQQAISNIPNDDKEFTLNIAKSYLEIQGEKGLATVINLWDDLGVKGCLTAERTEIVRAFATLRVLLSKTNQITEDDKDIVLTAFTQEFERRAGQKRKKRAGGSLEDVTDFILNFYRIKRASSPEHFQADIEIDNWVKTKDGWLIGISCKRTLRERWKQVSSAESTILSKYKIKYIYHILTYDEDLSDEKLTSLGGHRHIFYLPDESRRLKYAESHVGLKDYVRPISELINDLQKQL